LYVSSIADKLCLFFTAPSYLLFDIAAWSFSSCESAACAAFSCKHFSFENVTLDSMSVISVSVRDVCLLDQLVLQLATSPKMK